MELAIIGVLIGFAIGLALGHELGLRRAEHKHKEGWDTDNICIHGQYFDDCPNCRHDNICFHGLRLDDCPRCHHE
jgi:hypothetical protein